MDSTLKQYDGFVFLFWFLVAFPLAFWHLWYFSGKKKSSESELVRISTDFKGINFKYLLFSIFVLMPLLLFSLFVFLSVGENWTPSVFGVKFFPVMFVIFAPYGIYQALFAFYSGVYPTGKSFLYVHADKSLIQRVAKSQIVICLGVYLILLFWAWIS